MLKKRVITTLVIIPLPVAAIWFGEPWFTALMAVVAVLGVMEFYRLAVASRASPLACIGVVLTLLFIVSRNPNLLSFLAPRFDPGLLIPLLLMLAIALPMLWLLIRPRTGTAFVNWAWTLGGILYVGWLLSHLVSLRGMTDGMNWVFLVILANAASDTTAFFIGRSFGRHRLAPRISPNKTWEGALAGVVGAMVFSLLFTAPRLFAATNPLYVEGFIYWQALSLGLLVSVFGQLGDLAESLLKRHAGVKDSGGLLPGHGGILDRMDSIIFAGIVVYYYVVWVIQ
ncbi:MAG: phosphatidate cytidylyltransferase [Dehalococcoidales bacterium]|nr:phosphatidate cytidylyltransferase [Dehalococcoidales bacterium]